ncbi:hypothetical protein AXFE_28040 [Acidithrix ferrooxidans]|uniref:Uncharacterized protein n=1 Tax=Acidithrix ferrooxidans TaxID=1280514 RepID=A0A0D8HES1_9ACTN|nr:hypothetical protein AXFE_28040 [Acidithrix ferrooxidans]
MDAPALNNLATVIGSKQSFGKNDLTGTAVIIFTYPADQNNYPNEHIGPKRVPKPLICSSSNSKNSKVD